MERVLETVSGSHRVANTVRSSDAELAIERADLEAVGRTSLPLLVLQEQRAVSAGPGHIYQVRVWPEAHGECQSGNPAGAIESVRVDGERGDGEAEADQQHRERQV